MERLKIEDIEQFEEQIKKAVGDCWEKYTYWKNKIDFWKVFGL